MKRVDLFLLREWLLLTDNAEFKKYDNVWATAFRKSFATNIKVEGAMVGPSVTCGCAIVTAGQQHRISSSRKMSFTGSN